MNEKNFNTRIVHKHDSQINWEKAINFIPKVAELIVYDIDDNYNYARIKIGDGTTKVNDLPFLNEIVGLENLYYGLTSEIVPSKALKALVEGKKLLISHEDEIFGQILFGNFNYNLGANEIFSTAIISTSTDELYQITLSGLINSETWIISKDRLTKYDEDENVFTQDEEPILAKDGDFWVDTNEDTYAQKKIYESPVEPIEALDGDIWIDTSDLI